LADKFGHHTVKFGHHKKIFLFIIMNKALKKYTLDNLETIYLDFYPNLILKGFGFLLYNSFSKLVQILNDSMLSLILINKNIIKKINLDN
jgi:hypothetical protein